MFGPAPSPNMESPKPLYTVKSFLQQYAPVSGNYAPKKMYHGREKPDLMSSASYNSPSRLSSHNSKPDISRNYSSGINSHSLTRQALSPLYSTLLQYSSN